MAEPKGNLALVFGGGGGGDAPAPAGGRDESELDELAGDDLEEEDAPPADFAVHASEAFPELAGDEARLDALYRTIKACHPRV